MKEEKLLTQEEILEMYENNTNGFKDYVDKWCECRNQPVTQVLRFLLVNYKAQDCKGEFEIGEFESHTNFGC